MTWTLASRPWSNVSFAGHKSGHREKEIGRLLVALVSLGSFPRGFVGSVLQGSDSESEVQLSTRSEVLSTCAAEMEEGWFPLASSHFHSRRHLLD